VPTGTKACNSISSPRVTAWRGAAATASASERCQRVKVEPSRPPSVVGRDLTPVLIAYLLAMPCCCGDLV